MKNKLREILNSGRTAIGTHISFADSTVTEIMGLAGYDYLWIDTEHTSFTLEDLRNHLVAAEAAGIAAIVRVPEVSQVKAKPVLEMGPAGIVFPQVNSYELALEAVAACRYPPKGNRGWGPRRAMHFGMDMTAQEYIASSDDVLTILQFENIAAYADLTGITLRCRPWCANCLRKPIRRAKKLAFRTGCARLRKCSAMNASELT